MINQGDIVEDIPIIKMAAEGKCLAKIEGRVVFTNHTAPGDICDLKILKIKKNHLVADPVKIKSPSDRRANPFCSHFGICGGCKWQHVNYATQLAYKEEQVKDALERIGKTGKIEVLPIIPSDNTTFYRNKLEFAFSNQRWLTTDEVRSGIKINRDGLGFHMPGRYDKILDIEHCYLQSELSDGIRNGLKEFSNKSGYSFFHPYKLIGELRNLIIRNSNLGEVMVIVQLAQIENDRIIPLMEYLKETFPQITSLNYILNTKKNDTYFDLEVYNYSGQSYITEDLGGLKLRLGPKSFYQTNSDQALKLYKVTADLAGLKGAEIVYDLYTGIGSIALYLANQTSNIIGIDYNEMSIREARENARLNGIRNARFFAGDIKDLLNEQFAQEQGKPEVIITDPPRAGMHYKVIDAIMKISPEKVVYISCNPATQARDLEILKRDYAIKKVQPLDMFPHTHHVENIVLLEKKNVQQRS